MSGHMSESLATQATRRELTARQAETVRKLTEAGVDEVRRVGYEHLSIRDVARRAGVAAATAYTYFASRDHLLTEIFWRRLKALPPVITSPPAVKERAAAVLRELALIVSAEPELAAGCAAAMFGSDPNVRRLRLEIGIEIRRRIEAVAGPGSAAARLLELAYFGAMVEAGLGYTTYGHVADRLAEAADLIMG
jgi:AcrR family transcriptional regulator